MLNRDGTISIRLPDGRILDYADQTTVTVLLNKDKTPVKDLLIVVTDRNGNYSAEKTDAKGQVTVPGTSGITGPDGKVTIGWIDADGNRYTITLKVVDYENGGRSGHSRAAPPLGGPEPQPSLSGQRKDTGKPFDIGQRSPADVAGGTSLTAGP